MRLGLNTVRLRKVIGNAYREFWLSDVDGGILRFLINVRRKLVGNLKFIPAPFIMRKCGILDGLGSVSFLANFKTSQRILNLLQLVGAFLIV